MRVTRYIKTCFLGLSLGLFLFCGNMAVAATSSAQRHLVVHWVNLQPEDGLIVDAVVLFFHDGSFNLYQTGSAPSPLLQKLVKRQFDDLQSLAPETKVSVMKAPHEPDPLGGVWGGLSTVSPIPDFDSGRYRYATAYIAVRPSNDAFIANEDSYRIRLFDVDGSSELPAVIEFGGADVMDAGLCVNNEESLRLLDVREASEQPCRAENGVVRRHPGFNGSVRNPIAKPVRILGGTSTDQGGATGVHRYDATSADFSRGGTRIGRLVFMLAESNSSYTGSYYNPTRDGEGFNIEVFRPEGDTEDVAVIYWYTYERGTGKPLWLLGSGRFGQDIPLYSGSGGAVNSETNPTNVVKTRWGTLNLGLPFLVDWCLGGISIPYKPDDPLIPAGTYLLERLTPRGDAADLLCRQLYPPTRHIW